MFVVDRVLPLCRRRFFYPIPFPFLIWLWKGDSRRGRLSTFQPLVNFQAGATQIKRKPIFFQCLIEGKEKSLEVGGARRKDCGNYFAPIAEVSFLPFDLSISFFSVQAPADNYGGRQHLGGKSQNWLLRVNGFSLLKL